MEHVSFRTMTYHFIDVYTRLTPHFVKTVNKSSSGGFTNYDVKKVFGKQRKVESSRCGLQMRQTN